MFKINDNYLKLPGSYLFSTIAKKVNAYFFMSVFVRAIDFATVYRVYNMG